MADATLRGVGPNGTRDGEAIGSAAFWAALGGLIAAVLRWLGLAGAPPPAFVDENASEAVTGYERLPLSFEPNAGRFPQRFDFASRGPGYSVLLDGSAAVLGLSEV